MGSLLILILLMTIDILSRKKGNRLKSYQNEIKLLWSISRSKITDVFSDDKSGDIYYVTEDDKNNDFKMIVEKYFFDCYIVSQIHVANFDRSLESVGLNLPLLMNPPNARVSTTTISFGTICSFKKYLLKKSRIRLKGSDINTFEKTDDVYEKLDAVFKAKARNLKIKSLLKIS